MKEINIKIKIVDYMNNETITDTTGKIDDEKGIITYFDKGIEVCVIISDNIIMKRLSNDYKFELIFDKNQKTNSNYELFEPHYTMKMETETRVLERDNNNFYVEYFLKTEDEEIGLFCVDFKVEE